jgi:hypothetical protein
LAVDCDDESHVLTRIPLRVERRSGEQVRRERSFRLEDLLACPDCLAGDPEVGPDSVRCRACGASYESLRGTPLFAPAGVPLGSRFLEIYYIYPNSEESGHGVDSTRMVGPVDILMGGLPRARRVDNAGAGHDR